MTKRIVRTDRPLEILLREIEAAPVTRTFMVEKWEMQRLMRAGHVEYLPKTNSFHMVDGLSQGMRVKSLRSPKEVERNKGPRRGRAHIKNAVVAQRRRVKSGAYFGKDDATAFEAWMRSISATSEAVGVLFDVELHRVQAWRTGLSGPAGRQKLHRPSIIARYAMAAVSAGLMPAELEETELRGHGRMLGLACAAMQAGLKPCDDWISEGVRILLPGEKRIERKPLADIHEIAALLERAHGGREHAIPGYPAKARDEMSSEPKKLPVA